jgi:IS30 family transposase
MYISSIDAPDIVQPIFFRSNSRKYFDPFTVKDQPLLDRYTRWRKLADSLKLPAEGRLRLEWMIFYETAGSKSAYTTAKHFGIAPKTFYKWHKRFGNGMVRNLVDYSKAPIRKRTSTLTLVQESRIRNLRSKYIHFSKMKLSKMYLTIYGESISPYKIQVIINKYNLYPDRVKREKLRKKLKRNEGINRIGNLEMKDEHWFLFHLDTIVFYWQHLKRYILTATDHTGKIAYARMYTTKSSASAKDFLYRLNYLIDAPITNIQTDNGSEFFDQFEDALKELEITHWFSRPRTPEDNAVAERFNQTIQVEWINDGNFTTDINKFNKELTKWLIEYNFIRPHVTLDYMTPIEYLEDTLRKQQKLLPMYSTGIYASNLSQFML